MASPPRCGHRRIPRSTRSARSAVWNSKQGRRAGAEPQPHQESGSSRRQIIQ